MRAAGIDVSVGLLGAESRRLNGAFFAFHQKYRPYITLKWAQSSDGFIDHVRAGHGALKVSDNISRIAVHKLRASHDAILVGTRTALLDNPSLDVRFWSGRSPLRVVVDRKGVLPHELHLFDGSQPTVVFTENPQNCFGKNIEQVVLGGDASVVEQITGWLHSRKINSLLVEGGSATLQSFIDAGIWDSARVETNPSLTVAEGVAAPCLVKAVKVSEEKCGGNIVSFFDRV